MSRPLVNTEDHRRHTQLADVCIDVGGTGVRARVLHPRDGSIIESPIDAESVAALVSALTASGHAYRRIAIGATGVWGDARRFDVGVFDPLAPCEVRVADDGFCAHLGALGGMPGIVTAIGTGLVTVRRDADGSCSRVGGHGLLLDDRGSGAWIGQRAIHHAIDSHETGRDDGILDLCVGALGPIAIWPEVASQNGARLLARLCEPLATLAREGDQDARSIFREAGAHIARRVSTAAGGAEGVITASFTGGVVGALDLLLPSIRSGTMALPLTIVSARGTPLDGAELLLRMPPPEHASPLVQIHTRG